MPPPNFVVLFVDDWGWGDLGANCLHMGDVRGAQPDALDKETACTTATGVTLTPRLDALAASGMRLTDFHATGVCTPSRAQLQTGRMGARTGVTSNFGPGALGGLPTTEMTIASLVKTKGYATAAAGKWHMGVKNGFHPIDHGYDHFLGLPESNDYGCTDTTMGAPDSGCLNWRADRCPRNAAEAAHPPSTWDGPNCHPGPRNPWNYSLPLLSDRDVIQQPADLEGSKGMPISQKYANFGADFIARSAKAKTPFLLYIAWSHVHVPLVNGLQFQGKSGKGVLGDSIMEVDFASAIVLDALKAHGVEDNTLVIVSGDNGPPEDQCDWGGSKGPFLGAASKTLGGGGGSAGKLTSWEGGHREVGIAAWPGTIGANQVSNALTTTMDIFPTIAALIGTPLPADRIYDGIDLAPLLFDPAPTHTATPLLSASASAVEVGHEWLVFSVAGNAYSNSGLPNAKPCGPTSTGSSCPLFEAVRTGRWSAMFMVGFHGSCCRCVLTRVAAPRACVSLFFLSSFLSLSFHSHPEPTAHAPTTYLSSPATGDANTPYNASCSNSEAKGGNPALGVVGQQHAWLKVPLLFDFSVDVAQAHPLTVGSALHTEALRDVEAVLTKMNTSLWLPNKLMSTANFKSDFSTAVCCNRTNVVCRCHEEEA